MLRVTHRATYMSYIGMKQRCNDPNHSRYADYGGRGIKVCAAWQKSFEQFLADMGPRPVGTSIDRIDVKGDYAPDNCRWATRSEQARNRRDKRLIEIDGHAYHVAELAEIFGLNPRTIAVRHERGYSIDQILSPTLLHGTFNRTKTHCKRGHEFTTKNTYLMQGKRVCRACARLKTARYREKQQRPSH